MTESSQPLLTASDINADKNAAFMTHTFQTAAVMFASVCRISVRKHAWKSTIR